MNPEELLISNNVSKEEELLNCERLAFDELSMVEKQYQLSIDDFRGLFTKEEIERDKKAIEDRKKEMKPKTERSILLEKILITKAEENDWFGNGLICPVTEFDDVINGVDFIVEYEDEEGDFYLAVDCTVSDKKEDIFEKVEKNQKKMKIGLLSQVKYFQSETDYIEENGEMKGRKKTINMVPRVIVSINKENIKKFCKEYSENKNLGHSYLQILMLEEIVFQLRRQVDKIDNGELKFNENVKSDCKKKMVRKISRVEEHLVKILDKKRCSKEIDNEAADRAIENSRTFDFY